jgi:hypothetical protein
MVVSFGAGVVRETPVGLIGTLRLSTAPEILVTPNLTIWNAAISYALVVQDIVAVGYR